MDRRVVYMLINVDVPRQVEGYLTLQGESVQGEILKVRDSSEYYFGVDLKNYYLYFKFMF